MQFGRFEVEIRDVCSRVERLIGDSYLKRTNNNPQTVAYVPDPDAVEVHVVGSLFGQSMLGQWLTRCMRVESKAMQYI